MRSTIVEGKATLVSIQSPRGRSRIPAKRVGKKWMYDREELAEWMRSSSVRLEDFFLETEADIDANENLREP